MSPQISFRITTAYVFHFVYHERLRFLSGFFLEGSMIRQTSTLNYPLYRRSSLTGLIVGTPGGSIRHVKSPCRRYNNISSICQWVQSGGRSRVCRHQRLRHRPFGVHKVAWQAQPLSGMLLTGEFGPLVILRRRVATPTES